VVLNLADMYENGAVERLQAIGLPPMEPAPPPRPSPGPPPPPQAPDGPGGPTPGPSGPNAPAPGPPAPRPVPPTPAAPSPAPPAPLARARTRLRHPRRPPVPHRRRSRRPQRLPPLRHRRPRQRRPRGPRRRPPPRRRPRPSPRRRPRPRCPRTRRRRSRRPPSVPEGGPLDISARTGRRSQGPTTRPSRSCGEDDAASGVQTRRNTDMICLPGHWAPGLPGRCPAVPAVPPETRDPPQLLSAGCRRRCRPATSLSAMRGARCSPSDRLPGGVERPLGDSAIGRCWRSPWW